MTNKKRVLWIDDDKIKDRMIYFEEIVIRRKLGWRLDIATNLMDAANFLSKNEYNAIILDQGFPKDPVPEEQIPYYAPDKQNIWMGMVLLYWLKSAPPEWFEEKNDATLKAYHDITTSDIEVLRNNKTTPIMILSVLEQEEIEEGRRNLKVYLEKKNLPKANISIIGKPVTELKITRFLRSIDFN